MSQYLVNTLRTNQDRSLHPRVLVRDIGLH